MQKKREMQFLKCPLGAGFKKPMETSLTPSGRHVFLNVSISESTCSRTGTGNCLERSGAVRVDRQVKELQSIQGSSIGSSSSLHGGLALCSLVSQHPLAVFSECSTEQDRHTLQSCNQGFPAVTPVSTIFRLNVDPLLIHDVSLVL